jgi:phenylpropionate dioxygenase-like ring-hydroxylating dioxygenase large terminal subunit
MDRAGEIGLLKTLLKYAEEKTTSLAPAPWLHDVSKYTSVDRLQLEEEVLIRGRRPIVLGLSCDWPHVGSYRADDYAGVPILTIRGKDGKLRAFLNACRHRGAKVASGCGVSMAFKCPYHSWSYGQDGRLIGIPDEEIAFPGVRDKRSGLTRLALAEKYGMVWAIPKPPTDHIFELEIDDYLGGLGEDLAFWNLEKYHFYTRHIHYEEMNWKILLDTFFEAYHFGHLHADTLRNVLLPNIADFKDFGDNFRLTYARSKLPRLNDTPEAEWDLMWNTLIVYNMFANTIFSPQGDHIEIYRMFPVEGRPDRAVMETSLYIPQPANTEDEKRHWDANLDLAIKVITTEDFPAGRTMQEGFSSQAQSHLVFGRNEPALIHYHQSIDRVLNQV